LEATHALFDTILVRISFPAWLKFGLDEFAEILGG